MSTLPREFENPIDYAIIRICSKIAPFFKATYHRANFITFEGLILSTYGLYHLSQFNMLKFMFGYGLGYVFDCLDGYYARKYNDKSRFGEYFEHSKDIGCGILYFIILSQYYVMSGWVWNLFTLSFLGLVFQLAHQQAMIGSSGDLMDKLQLIVVNPYHIRKTRWVGCGTFMILSLIIPLILSTK